jgi:hypothetical protein
MPVKCLLYTFHEFQELLRIQALGLQQGLVIRGTEHDVSDLMKVSGRRWVEQSEYRLCSQPDRDGVIRQEGTPRKDCDPRKTRARYQASGEQGFICVPQDRNGERKSGRAKVQGHRQAQSLESPAALLPRGLGGGGEQAQATVQDQHLLHTLHEFQELCGKRAMMYVSVVGAL